MKSCSQWIRRFSRTALPLVLGVLVASAGLADTVTYVYDDAGRLTVAKHSNGTLTHYTLDAAGNRTNVVTSLDTTAPTVPTGLTGTASSSQRQVTLSWSASTDAGSGVAGYHVYRGGSQIGSSSTTTSYTDNSVACATGYSYTVSAFDNATPPNVSAQSTAWSVTTPAIPPTAPTGLTETSKTSTQVALSWSASSDICVAVSGYRVYRGGTQIGTSSTTSYTDGTTTGTTTYSYTVAAYDSLGSVSAQSSPLSVTTPDTIAPSVPTGLAGTAVSSSQINLSWNASTDTGGSGLAGYYVYRNGSELTTTTTNSYQNTGLAGSTTYSYAVAAYDHAGNVSAKTSSINVTTPSGAPTVPGQPEPQGTIATSPWTESWTASTGAVAYYIFSANSVNHQVNAPTTSYNMTGAACVTYTMKVQACTSGGVCSAFSASSSITYAPRGIGTCNQSPVN
ncbi:MAG: hypothetical protein WBW93_09225 [Steroidobacteraceae bacterium]